MPDYQRIRYNCEKVNRITVKFVDRFLLPLFASEEGLEKKFAQMLDRYRQAVQKMPEDWPFCSIGQYMAFQLFRRDGMARRYLDHLQVRRRDAKELDYLKFQIDHPWRFAFCFVSQALRDSFFQMTDVITGEEFLLFSPGIADMERRGGVSIYFILIGFNGECWQTYGTIAYFKGFQPFDLLYFAKLLKPDLASMDEIPSLIEQDPLPFMMLWSGGELPTTWHKDDMVVLSRSEYDLKSIIPENFTEWFDIEKRDAVYRFTHRRLYGFPHFCQCFYTMEDRKFKICAMTERGYNKLIWALNKSGVKFPKEPQLKATMAMFLTANNVLEINMELAPLEKLFVQEQPAGKDEETDRINRFIKRLLECINSDREYDLSELAADAGIDNQTALLIAGQISKRMAQDLKKYEERSAKR